MGDVGVSAGHAVLGDSGADSSALYQGVELAPGSYLLDFDLNAIGLSQSGQFLDAFYASIYFTNDLSNFDPLGAVGTDFDDVLPLFDLDASGLTIWASGVTSDVSAPPLSTDWVHFSVVFDNTYAYAAPTFERFNANSQQGDSSVLVDNVRIRAAIPEPAPILLLVTVFLPLAATRWGGRG